MRRIFPPELREENVILRKESPSVSTPHDPQQIQREFLALLPLTISLAGLPASEPGRYYGEEQIEARAFTIKHAFRAAQGIIRDLPNSPR